MINSELGHCKTLEEFHSEIRRQQEEAHGIDYCQIHDAIKKYMADCESYMELGTHQGGTASAALLCNPKELYIIDIDLSRYRKFLEPIAEKYAAKNGIIFKATEIDSTSPFSAKSVDMLVIDSYHNATHMKKELDTHGFNVSKYIIAHDTSIINGKPNDSLYKVLVEYGKKYGWSVIERGVTNVGYTVLKKNG